MLKTVMHAWRRMSQADIEFLRNQSLGDTGTFYMHGVEFTRTTHPVEQAPEFNAYQIVGRQGTERVVVESGVLLG